MGWQITFDGTERELSDEELLDPFAQRWEGGKVVNLDDLSPDVFDKIASAEEDSTDSWWGVYRFPCSVGSRMWEVAKAAAEHAGVEVPAKPANMREAQLLMRQFERTQDVAEKPMVDGFPPTPPLETGSSSGLSEPSGGDLPKSEAND